MIGITTNEDQTDVAEYLSELDWQDLVGASVIEAAQEVFDVTSGTQHQYLVRLIVDPSTDVESLSEELSSLSFLDWAQPNYYWTGQSPLSSPNDPLIYVSHDPDVFLDYYVEAGLIEAWDITRGAVDEVGVVIGSLEGGFDETIADISPNAFVHAGEINGNGIDDDNNGYIDDRYGIQPAGVGHHATITASVAVSRSNNAAGYAGVAGEARIIGAGPLSFVNAIQYLIANEARAVYNFVANTDITTPAEECALKAAIQNKLLVVSSSGNNFDTFVPTYGSDLLLLVAGVDEDDENMLTFGPYVDIVAQAEKIPIAREATHPQPYGFGSYGMSYVMPQLAGLAALIWSVWPEYTTEQVVARMLGTASDEYLATDAIEDMLDVGYYGAGRYDAGAAVDSGVAIAPPTFDPDLVRFNDTIFSSTVDEPLEQIWLFSKQVLASATFKDASNWQLLYAGADGVFDQGSDDEEIAILPMASYSIGSRWASIEVKGEMPNGNYKLIAKASGLEDPFGTALDGNGDETAGDDFEYFFAYTGHVDQAAPTTSTSLGAAGDPMSVAIHADLDEEFAMNQAFNRSNGQYVDDSWSVDVDWGDGSAIATYAFAAPALGQPMPTFGVLPAHTYANPGTYTIVLSVMGTESLGPATVQIEVVIDSSEHWATVEHAGAVKDLLLWGSPNADTINIEGDASSLSVSGIDIVTPVTLFDTELTGVTGRILLWTFGGNDQLSAGDVDGVGIDLDSGDGNDYLVSGSGADLVLGGLGNDFVWSDVGRNTIYGGSGNDTLLSGNGSSPSTDGGVVHGEGDNDDIDVGGGNYTIDGGAGDDSIWSGAGNDSILGGAGNDVIDVGLGNDTVQGSDGHDEISTDGGADQVSGGNGDDTIFAGEGNDTVYGDDSVLGGSGDDFILGEGGNDLIFDGVGGDTVRGGSGNDVISAFSGNNIVFGDEGNDIIAASSPSQISMFVGGVGSDLISDPFGGNLVITDRLFGLSEEDIDLVAAEWFATGTGHSFTERVNHLSGTASGGYNEDVYLIAGEGVLDDSNLDQVYIGSSTAAASWYFLSLATDQIQMTDDEYNAANVYTNVSGPGVSGEYTAVRGESVQLTLSAGQLIGHLGTTPVDIGDYYFDIDWNGDDVIDQTVNGGNNVTVAHTYTTDGDYQVKIFVRGEDTPAGTYGTHSLDVNAFEVRGVEGVDTLYIGGTTASDLISVSWNAGVTYVLLNGGSETFSTSTLLECIVVFAQDGNDGVELLSTPSDVDVTVSGAAGNDIIVVYYADGGAYLLTGDAGYDEIYLIDGADAALTMTGGAGEDVLVLAGGDGITAVLQGDSDKDLLASLSEDPTVITALGGAGDDIIAGGLGNDSLDGGTGNDMLIGSVFSGEDEDTLVGGDGNDVLIGAKGADSIRGNAGEDLLIGGSLSSAYYEEAEAPDIDGIVQVWMQWSTTDTFANRMAYLTGTVGGIVEAQFAFDAGTTVLDDDAADILLGDGDPDWFLCDPDDDVRPDFDSESGDELMVIDS